MNGFLKLLGEFARDGGACVVENSDDSITISQPEAANAREKIVEESGPKDLPFVQRENSIRGALLQ
jgi:hypothetical protein